jgi:hypothetical protein
MGAKLVPLRLRPQDGFKIRARLGVIIRRLYSVADTLMEI